MQKKKLTFQYLWRCYRQDAYWENFGGFSSWWKIPFLKRADWKFAYFEDGYMPYDVSVNRMYPADVAFCINYLDNLMELLADHECEPVDIPEDQEPPEDMKDPANTGIRAEFIKVSELQQYLGQNYELFLKAMEKAKAGIVFNDDETIVGFYVCKS